MDKQQTLNKIKTSFALLLLCLIFIPKTECLAADDASETSGSSISVEDYKDIISELKEELKEGNLDSEEDIRNAIHEAEDKYGVDVPDADEQKAVEIMDTVKDLGVDNEKLAEVVDDVYDNIADKTFESASEAMDEIQKQVVESAKEAVVDSVKKTMADYFKDLWERIKEFFRGLFVSWIG